MRPLVPSRARRAQYTRLVICTSCTICHLYRRVQARAGALCQRDVRQREFTHYMYAYMYGAARALPLTRQRGHFHSQGSEFHSRRTTATGTAIPRTTGHARTTCAHTEGGTCPCRQLVCRMPTEPAVDGAYMKPGVRQMEPGNEVCGFKIGSVQLQ